VKFVCLISFVPIALMGMAVAAAPSTELVDRVVAQINDEYVFLSELREIEAEEGGAAATSALRRLSRHDLLERIIDAKLLEQEAARLGVAPPEEVIAEAVDDQIARLFAAWPDPYTLDEHLGRQGMTRASLRQTLREDEARAWSRRAVVLARMPSPPAEPDFEPQFDLSQIVLACPTSASEPVVLERYRVCLELRERVQAGENFALLANSHSDDPLTAPRGGQIGLVELGTLDPGIAEALEGLGTSDLSLPIRTAVGWHLLRADRLISPRQQWQMQAFDETRDSILAELRERAHIETFEQE